MNKLAFWITDRCCLHPAVLSCFDAFELARFGFGVFETLFISCGIPYRWDDHMERLENGLAAIRIADMINHQRLLSSVLSLINGVENGLLRITVFGASTDSQCPLLLLESLPPRVVPKDAVALALSSHKKPPSSVFPTDAKILCRLGSILAKNEAVQRYGCFEALRCNLDDQICDVSSGNIFWFKNETLFTPNLECGILPGITRKRIIELSPFKVIIGDFKLSDILTADAVFITNVSWIALPVNLIKHKQSTHFCSNKITTIFKKIIIKDREEYCIERQAHQSNPFPSS